MDLTAVLLRAAARRPHVLVVSAVGATAERLAVEAAMARRGWPPATAPADVDVLVVAGSPGPALDAVIEQVWARVPAPRARAHVRAPDHADRELDEASALLADPALQRAQAPSGATPSPATGGRPGAHDGEPEGHAHHDAGHDRAGDEQSPDHLVGHEHREGGHPEPEDHGGREADAAHGSPEGHRGAGDRKDIAHGGHEGGGHEAHGGDAAPEGHGGHGSPGGHGAHAGHGGGMELPGGLPMADLGDDRDGLRLDRLHVPLGPVLPDWPPGLVVRTVMQGDVIQEASAEVLDAGSGRPFWRDAHPAARELDGLARFLGVAGWADASARARRLRDELLAGASAEHVRGSAAALVRRVRRSRTLRWQLRGLPAGPTDVAALLDGRLAAVEAAVSAAAGSAGLRASRAALDELAGLLVGSELAAARLIVAAVDPETEGASPHEEVRHG